jgi:hypothetical protein
VSAIDLTAAEQTHVRTALRFLRARSGTWASLAKVLRYNDTSLSGVACGTKPVSAELAFRVARLAEVGVDDLLAGRFPPPGTCPHCGHRPVPAEPVS